MQDDRFEVGWVGWGAEDESWSLDYRRIYGDPTTPGFWEAVDAATLRVFKHPSGLDMRVEATCIDAQGHFTQQVYDFCRPRKRRNVYAILGRGGGNKPIWPRKLTKNAAKKIDVAILVSTRGKTSITSGSRSLSRGRAIVIFRSEWIPPARLVIDPLKEWRAEAEAVTLGAKALEQVTREKTGGDWKSNTEQRAREHAARVNGGLEPAILAGPGGQPEQAQESTDTEEATGRDGDGDGKKDEKAKPKKGNNNADS